MHRSLRAAVLILGLCLYGQAHALTYYVRSDGASGNNGLSNSAGGAKRNISSLNSLVNPGDTVFIVSINPSDSASTSLNRINPVNAGADGDPIVYRNLGTVDYTQLPIPGMDPFNDINVTIAGVRFKGHVKFQYPVRNIQIDTSIFMNFWSCEGAENIHIRGGRSYKASGQTDWFGWGGETVYNPDHPNRNIQCSDHYFRHDGIGDEQQGIYQRGGPIDVQWNRVTFSAMWNPTLGGSASTSNLFSIAGENTGCRFDSCRFIMDFVPGTGYDPVTWYGVISIRDEADGTVFDSCSFQINRNSTSGTHAVFISKTGTTGQPQRNTTISRCVFKFYRGYFWEYSDNQPGLEVKNCVILTRGDPNYSGYRVTNAWGSNIKFHHNTIYAPFGRSLYTGDNSAAGPISINNNIFVRVNTSDHQDSAIFKAKHLGNTTMNRNLYWTTNGVAGDSAYCITIGDGNGEGQSYRYGIRARLGANGSFCTSYNKDCLSLFANPGFSSYDFDTFDPSPRQVAGSTNNWAIALASGGPQHPDSAAVNGGQGYDGNTGNDYYVGAVSPASSAVSDTTPPKAVGLTVIIGVGDVTTKSFFWTDTGDDSATGKAESVFVCERVGSADINASNWPTYVMTNLDDGTLAAFAAELTGTSRNFSGRWGTDAAPEPCAVGPCTAAYYCIVVKDDAKPTANVRVGPVFAGEYYP